MAARERRRITPEVERPEGSRSRGPLALPVQMLGDMTESMSPPARRPTRRVTANLPADLLERARRATGKGITDTLVEGLELVRRSSAASKARALRGKLKLDLDLESARGRAGH